ncbi:MAG: histone deacetylase family protein [Dokdonella sp.]|nr:histone deacetylase family protein [Dokdonella sp.]
MTHTGGAGGPAGATVALYTHAACLDHDPGPGHPERIARLETVLDALAPAAFPSLQRREAPRASRAQLARVHARHHIDGIVEHGPLHYWRMLDADTLMSPGSVEAALRAAGAVSAAVDAVVAGEVQRAFCAVRPPGHHATRDSAMGFCLFNNIAVGAAQALAEHALERVAIVDFDVHHGNGTQDIFWREPRVLYASSHQSPLYPGTGASEETGVGNIVNAPLPPEAGSAGFRAAFEQVLLPELDAFAPQLVLISAGFDAHRLDPLANLNLEAADYGWVTRQLVELARRHAGGRVVSSLEGGYSLDALRQSSAAHVAALLG